MEGELAHPAIIALEGRSCPFAIRSVAMTAIDVPANARSRRTRAALLDATAAVLETDGFEMLTMAEVAQRAGVTRRAVYLHFTSRAELLSDLFGQLADEDALGESAGAVWDAPDAVTALARYAEHVAGHQHRLRAVAGAAELLGRTERDARPHHERIVRRQMSPCRRLATWLDNDGRLRSPWTTDTAADLLWMLTASPMLDRLHTDRHWSPARVADHLAELLHSTLVQPVDAA
jgi:AcrR family transcriptional regulator